MFENPHQRHAVDLIFCIFERILEHQTNILGFDLLHVPVRIETLPLFLALTQRNNVIMAFVAMECRDQFLYFGGWPLDPLEENAAAENQHPGYAIGKIVALRRLDDATNF
ncbi:hypothetical protein ASF28_12670 [Methylobacterium sp. Leaf99]|nr:hypothetical protein ASF28_12670 [Methylobacterium sp. Leaf99]